MLSLIHTRKTVIMRNLIVSLIILLTVAGCVSTTDKQKISFQAARLDRAVALIESGTQVEKPSQQDLEDFIRAERSVWHALDFSINGTPLPKDLDKQ